MGGRNGLGLHLGFMLRLSDKLSGADCYFETRFVELTYYVMTRRKCT